MGTIGEALLGARRRLAASAADSSPREARLLLASLLGGREVELLGRDREPLPPAIEAAFAALIARRAGGEPVAYLLGEREFWGLSLRVDDRVLVPRPETEHLVETALEIDLGASPRILDLGTGSGCIAVALAVARPDATVVAVDRSPAALAVAAANARRHGVAARVPCLAGDLATALVLDSFRLVVSNPPYLDPRRAGELPLDVRAHEPAAALFAGRDGLEVLRRLVGEVGPALRTGTVVLAEIGAGQLAAVSAALAGSACELLRVVADLAGVARVVVLRRR